jgi:YhcH/YjgK/YiaL family protein
MIVSRREHLDRYRGLSAALDRAIAWVKAGGYEGLPVGRNEIDGENVYAMVQRYTTKAPEACTYEAHRNYIDIQFLVSGSELMGVAPESSLKVQQAYKPDAALYEDPEGLPEEQLVPLVPGNAAILFPEDAHKPCMRRGDAAEEVHKIVVKVIL